MRKHTQHNDAVNREMAYQHIFNLNVIANIHGVWYSDVSHLAYFEVSTPSLSLYNHKLRTLRYKNVMRDQRCLCPELDALVCSCPFVVWLCSPRQAQTIKRCSSEVTAPVTTSTYVPLVQMTVLGNSIGTSSIILLIRTRVVRTPIVYHCSQACNCKTYQGLNETVFSPRTLEIAACTKITDYRPQTWIIWDYGHIQGIDISGWWTWLAYNDGVRAGHLYRYAPLSRISDVDGDHETLWANVGRQIELIT
jgi:hypothetical protein